MKNFLGVQLSRVNWFLHFNTQFNEHSFTQQRNYKKRASWFYFRLIKQEERACSDTGNINTKGNSRTRDKNLNAKIFWNNERRAIVIIATLSRHLDALKLAIDVQGTFLRLWWRTTGNDEYVVEPFGAMSLKIGSVAKQKVKNLRSSAALIVRRLTMRHFGTWQW